MRLATPSAGLVAVALATAGFTAPFAATSASAAPAKPAACLAGTVMQLSNHARIFMAAKNAKITFTTPGTHTAEVSKATTISARYGTLVVDDQHAILAAARARWTRDRNVVSVTTGHKITFTSTKGQTVTATYGAHADRVKWTKLNVHADCTSTVLSTGLARIPRNILSWQLVVSTP